MVRQHDRLNGREVEQTHVEDRGYRTESRGWRTEEPGELQSMELQRMGHDLATSTTTTTTTTTMKPIPFGTEVSAGEDEYSLPLRILQSNLGINDTKLTTGGQLASTMIKS